MNKTSVVDSQPLGEPTTTDAFARENALLRQRNAQLEASLNAIRDGGLDALLVAGEDGDRLFTPAGADHVYRLLVEEMGEGAITLTPKGVVAYANRRFAEMLGRPLQQVIGSRIAGCFAPEGGPALSALLKDGPVSKRSAEVDLLTGTGNRVPTLLSVRRLVIDGMPDAVCMVVTDLTVQKLGEVAVETRKTLLQEVEMLRETTEQSEEGGALLLRVNQGLILEGIRARDEADMAAEAYRKLSHRAEHDPLTRLPNRILLMDRVDQAIVNAKRDSGHLALLFLDLNKFKQINDTCGHGTGDQVLQLVATRLKSSVREADTVSRHGGDEFLILLSSISQASDAALIADKIASFLGAPAKVGDHIFLLTASIGVSVYPEDGLKAEELIERADTAMYRVKRRRP